MSSQQKAHTALEHHLKIKVQISRKSDDSPENILKPGLTMNRLKLYQMIYRNQMQCPHFLDTLKDEIQWTWQTPRKQYSGIVTTTDPILCLLE